MARAARRNLYRKTWWLPRARALFLMFLLPALPLPFPRSLPQGSLLCFSLTCTRPARSPCGYYLAQGGALRAKARSPAEAPSLPHGLPVKSSGAIWMGVPTMLPDIMASGLQNPKSVILARSCLSSCQQSRGESACIVACTQHPLAHSSSEQTSPSTEHLRKPPCLQIHSHSCLLPRPQAT